VSVPPVVTRFYLRIWEEGDIEYAREILTENFEFRGSLGPQLVGIGAFQGYVTAVRAALADYRCTVLDCVTEGSRAFARMLFSGRHVGEFRGFPPTGATVSWTGAALFDLHGEQIRRLWVLGDLAGLGETLRKNSLHS
jgi:predicted ester cyclase